MQITSGIEPKGSFASSAIQWPWPFLTFDRVSGVPHHDAERPPLHLPVRRAGRAEARDAAQRDEARVLRPAVVRLRASQLHPARQHSHLPATPESRRPAAPDRVPRRRGKGALPLRYGWKALRGKFDLQAKSETLCLSVVIGVLSLLKFEIYRFEWNLPNTHINIL